MVEAVMFWNEPNNKSHWAFELDPEWRTFGAMVKLAADAVRAENPRVRRVLGGISPIDPHFVGNLHGQGVLDQLDVVAVHGFPLDWNHWCLDEWPAKLAEIQAITSLPIWISEVGVSTFGAEEVQEFGLRRTFELLARRAQRIHWYSLYDLPRAWPATTRHREAEGSAYYRHFYMGLLREDGTPKRALKLFPEYTPAFGICQWFHFEDHRLDDAVKWLRKLGVKHLRTGLSWADSFRPNAEAWFDRQMRALEEFEVTVTYCFTPEHRGVEPHHTSPPQRIEEFAEFCAAMTRRYASGAIGAEPLVAPATLERERETPSEAVPSDLLHRLCASPNETPPRTVMVVAHPDDDVIGAGVRLQWLRDLTILHVTDGAPRNMADALHAGCNTREEYAALRRRELEAALSLVGLQPQQARSLGFIDQDASLHLAELALRLAGEFAALEPEVVLTHPYEGGHPDHDATAFGVHAACRLLEARGLTPPVIVEMASYFGVNGCRVIAEFLPDARSKILCHYLTPEQCALKRRLLDCYASQHRVLGDFNLDREQFRLAPEYDFTQPPHEGRLLYEFYDWGMNGARWRTLASQALARLQLARPAPETDAEPQLAAAGGVT